LPHKGHEQSTTSTTISARAGHASSPHDCAEKATVDVQKACETLLVNVAKNYCSGKVSVAELFEHRDVLLPSVGLKLTDKAQTRKAKKTDGKKKVKKTKDATDTSAENPEGPRDDKPQNEKGGKKAKVAAMKEMKSMKAVKTEKVGKKSDTKVVEIPKTKVIKVMKKPAAAKVGWLVGANRSVR
jgi:hypothetical protein